MTQNTKIIKSYCKFKYRKYRYTKIVLNYVTMKIRDRPLRNLFILSQASTLPENVRFVKAFNDFVNLITGVNCGGNFFFSYTSLG